MKKKNLLQLSVVLCIAHLLFSCSSAEYYRLAPSQERAYQPVKAKVAPAAETKIASLTAPATEPTGTRRNDTGPVLEASIDTTPPTITRKTQTTPALLTTPAKLAGPAQLTSAEAQTLATVQSQLAGLTKTQKKELKTQVKDVLEVNASDTNIVEIILAILLPPVGVALHEGITSRFWISLLLTLLFIVPGIIFALLVVTDTI